MLLVGKMGMGRRGGRCFTVSEGYNNHERMSIDSSPSGATRLELSPPKAREFLCHTQSWPMKQMTPTPC